MWTGKERRLFASGKCGYGRPFNSASHFYGPSVSSFSGGYPPPLNKRNMLWFSLPSVSKTTTRHIWKENDRTGWIEESHPLPCQPCSSDGCVNRVACLRFFFLKGQIHQAIDTENIRRRQLTIINRKKQNPRSVTTFAISFLMARASDEKGHLAYRKESVSAVSCLVSCCTTTLSIGIAPM